MCPDSAADRGRAERRCVKFDMGKGKKSSAPAKAPATMAGAPIPGTIKVKPTWKSLFTNEINVALVGEMVRLSFVANVYIVSCAAQAVTVLEMILAATFRHWLGFCMCGFSLLICVMLIYDRYQAIQYNTQVTIAASFEVIWGSLTL